MQMTDIIVLALLVLLVVILFVLAAKNSKLAKENRVLKEILDVKDATIANLEAQRVSVKDVIDNFSASEAVMQCISEGKSREEISEELGIPLNKIELIIKFDKIKKEQSGR
jgi:hypothetical protein